MISAEKAALWACKAKAASDFGAPFLAGYDRDVMAYLGNELRLSHTMQRLGRWKWLLNTVISKAARSPELADAISMLFDDESERETNNAHPRPGDTTRSIEPTTKTRARPICGHSAPLLPSLALL